MHVNKVLRVIKTLYLIFAGFCCTKVLFNFASNVSENSHKTISLEKLQPPPIGGFYHFSTTGSHWKNIVNEQMLLAHLSGLINASSIIYMTGLGNITHNKSMYEMFANHKFNYEYNINTKLYEFVTLKKVEKFCLQNNDSFVWYAHSKGASHPDNFYGIWRDILNYFVLYKWQHCYNLLSSTDYTTCGAILTYDSVRQRGWNIYYAGNMWWAKCSHINRLTRIEKLNQTDRYIAELYVTSEINIGHFNCLYVNLSSPIRFTRDNASCTRNYPLWKIR